MKLVWKIARAALIGLGLGYALILGLMWANQGSFIYYPERGAPALGDSVLPGFGERVLTTDDGERIVAWWRPPADGEAVVVYFHGNGGHLGYRAGAFREIAGAGFGVLAIDYRGYGRSTGEPTEAGLYRDARAAWRFVEARAPDRPVVLWGESLGTAVAVELATEVDEVGVVLDSPLASMPSMARVAAPYVPPFLVTQRFDSLSRIDRIGSSLLIVHCDADGTVPIGQGDTLFQHAAEPKRFMRLRGCGHTDIWRKPAKSDFLAVAAGWAEAAKRAPEGG